MSTSHQTALEAQELDRKPKSTRSDWVWACKDALIPWDELVVAKLRRCNRARAKVVYPFRVEGQNRPRLALLDAIRAQFH